MHDGADYTPYEGRELTGWPTTVVLGGKIMVRDGTLTGRKGDGRYRARNRSQFATGLQVAV
jgi:dihydropyrimidinase